MKKIFSILLSFLKYPVKLALARLVEKKKEQLIKIDMMIDFINKDDYFAQAGLTQTRTYFLGNRLLRKNKLENFISRWEL